MALQHIQVVNIAENFAVEQANKTQAGEQFHKKISNRKGGAAIPASAPKNPVTDKRQIVINPDGLVAMAAARPRPNQAFFVRQPINANIDEAPPGGAEQKYRDEDKCEVNFKNHRLIVVNRRDLEINVGDKITFDNL